MIAIDARFTGLRGLAVLNVILAHYTYDGLITNPFFQFSGPFGVFIFFFLSAFLLTYRMNADLKKLNVFQSLTSYSINRLFRVVPLVLIVSITCYFFGIHFYSGNEGLLTPFYKPFSLGNAPSVFWTIPIEMIFYVYLPVLFVFFYIFRQHAHIIFLLFCCWCIVMALTPPLERGHYWARLAFSEFANCFIGGMVCFFVTKQVLLHQTTYRVTWLPMVALILLFPYPFNYMIGNKQMSQIFVDAHYNRIVPLVPIIIFSLFYYALQENSFSRFLKLRGLVGLGKISFPVYLIHEPVADIMKLYKGIDPSVTLLLAIIVVLLISTALHYWIEVPVIAFGKKSGNLLTSKNTYQQSQLKPD